MQAFSCTSINYRLVLKDTCKGSGDITVIDDNGGMINIPYTMNCTNITIIAENELGVSTNHSVNTTSPGESVSDLYNIQKHFVFQITVAAQYRCAPCGVSSACTCCEYFLMNYRHIISKPANYL